MCIRCRGPGPSRPSAPRGEQRSGAAWTPTAAAEWGRFGITVDALALPVMYAATRTAMSADQPAAPDAQLAVQMPLGDIERGLVPVLRFLAGPGSRFVTGQTIAVDGGMLMER
jgi:NAD(P)-dependent dehydrogenase (short-subunit alcohol dehydrogenase family)